MIVHISIIIGSVMMIDITGSISQRVIVSVCKKICQMFLRQIVSASSLCQQRSFQNSSHRKCPAHSIWILILDGGYIPLLCRIIIRWIGNSSSHRDFRSIIANLNGFGIGRQIIERSQLFLFFFLCKRASLDIFDSLFISFTVSVSECIIFGIRKLFCCSLLGKLQLTVRRRSFDFVCSLCNFRNFTFGNILFFIRFPGRYRGNTFFCFFCIKVSGHNRNLTSYNCHTQKQRQ